MAATVARARALAEKQRPEAAQARHLADLFCRISRRRVERLFDALWDNDDVQLYRAGVDVLDGRHEWLEKGILGLGTPEAPRGRAAEATLTFGIFPGADHRGRLPEAAGFAPGYLRTISAWINDRVATS
jgi:hypothetical protein